MIDKRNNFPLGYASTNTSITHHMHRYHSKSAQARRGGTIRLLSPTLGPKFFEVPVSVLAGAISLLHRQFTVF